MAMTVFQRPKAKSDTTPKISIRDGRFHYNAAFSKLADLSQFKSVIYATDPEERRIGFIFSKDVASGNAYTLENRGRVSAFRSSAHDLLKRNLWASAIVKESSEAPVSYEAIKDGKLWIIQLCPAFEYEVTRDQMIDIPSELSGIYRYINNSGAVVYIGKGYIRRRAQEEHRTEWNFEKIQYSVIASEEDQFKWEDFWIESYKDKNNGELPAYNRQSGNKS
jgi:hypothetical protein